MESELSELTLLHVCRRLLVTDEGSLLRVQLTDLTGGVRTLNYSLVPPLGHKGLRYHRSHKQLSCCCDGWRRCA